MPGHLPPQCAIHAGFLARSCGRCAINASPIAALERPPSSALRAHVGVTSAESRRRREQAESEAAARREEMASAEARSALLGRAR